MEVLVLLTLQRAGLVPLGRRAMVLLSDVSVGRRPRSGVHRLRNSEGDSGNVARRHHRVCGRRGQRT